MSETFRDDGAERDARLAALYRAAARDEPPPALDDAIRAAARRAVASRPQRVGASFIRSWRVPLSIAAVMVLTVSLVTVMREEAPQTVLPPGGLPGEADHQRAGLAADAGERSTAVPKTPAPPVQRPDSFGLRPPAQTGSSGIDLRENRVSPDPAPESRKDLAAPGRMESGAAAEGGKVESEPAAGADAAAGETSRARVKAAPGVEPSASPPAPSTAGATQLRADLLPDKWLELIAELRRQGKLEEAKTSLTEFRKRFPNHELPASVKEWAGP